MTTAAPVDMSMTTALAARNRSRFVRRYDFFAD
jgi:hypothetical protein